jgi:Peptidase family C54
MPPVQDAAYRYSNAETTCSHSDRHQNDQFQSAHSDKISVGNCAEEGRLIGGREEVEGELLYREKEEVEGMDRTFHSFRSGRLKISELDPSLSLCFLCHTEEDFDNLCIGMTQAYPALHRLYFYLCWYRYRNLSHDSY